MRLPALAPLLLVVLLLPGCTDGGNGDATLDVTCPQWTEDPRSVGTVTNIGFYNRREGGLPGQPRTMSDQFPLDGRTPPPMDRRVADRYRLELPGSGAGVGIRVDNGTLEVRAFRADDNSTLTFFTAAAPDDRKETLRFGSGTYTGLEWYVGLGPDSRDPVASVLRLEWTFTPEPGLVPNSGLDGGARVGASYSISAFVAYRAPGCNR
jgi:hypothetical protein